MDVILPKIALTMTSGVIVEWYRSPGDRVRRGDPLFAFETDKTTVDVEAERDGILRGVRAQVGEAILAGSVVAILEVSGEAMGPGATAATQTQAVSVAPAAAELAAALGVDLASVNGSGTGGRIIEQDVIAVATARTASGAKPAGAAGAALTPAPGATLEVARIDFSDARLAALPTLERSAAVPVFNLGGTLDFGGLEEAIRSAGVSILDILAIAVARALHEHPTCNGRFRDGQAETYAWPRIGILIRQGDALIPLIFDDPSEDTAIAFHQRRRAAQDAAGRGRVPAANSGTPTFVISNLGPFGVEWFTAMLYPDTSVTLALGTSGAGGLAASQVSAVLTCDHRLVDGVDAAKFIRSVRDAIPTVPIVAKEME